MIDLSLPGAELVIQGLEDLDAGRETVPALLVSLASTSLRELGIALPAQPHASPEEKLYRLLAAELGDGAHSRYNALRRRLSSFLRASACAKR